MSRAAKITQPTAPALTSPSLPKGWRMVRFGDVVNNLNETVSDPLKEGLERFVGLEHLEPRDLRIRTWGNIADGTTFNRRFRVGQVLFGKRRAYQRKAALADFSGICSGDIYVFGANEKHLVPEMLPFLVQSEGFAKHAEDTSEGSLSPRTKWKYLAEYEFALPSDPTEQRRIAELLAAADEAVEGWHVAVRQLVLTRESLLDSYYHRPETSGSNVSLCELTRSPITYGIVQAGPDTPGGIPYIRVSDMTAGKLTADGMLRTTAEIASAYSRSMVRSGDLVIALRGAVGLVLPVPEGLDGANLTQGTARVSVAASHVADYVMWALRSPYIRRQIASVEKGSTFKEITLEQLRNLKVPIPTSKTDEQLVAGRLNEITSRIEDAQMRVNSLNQIRFGLLKFMLTPPSETH